MIRQFRKHFFHLITLSLLLMISLPASGEDAPLSAQDVASLSLNGTAFLDADGDGFFSPGETGLANATVRLLLDGEEIASLATDEQGRYLFANLSPGRYVVMSDPFSGQSQTAPANRYEVTLSDKPAFDLNYGFFAPTNLTASLPAREYPLMRPSPPEAAAWTGQYNASAQAFLSPRIAAELAAAPPASYSLLEYLQYTPSERDQGHCGNCWAWAGTGVMEVDYARQMNTSDRFSVQYLDSNYNGGCGSSGACCGGWLESLAGFYNARRMIVPWSNANAHYRDGGSGCGSCSAFASTISTTPHYDLASISASTVPTHGLAREAAISNIKNVLQQGKAIWFAFFLPDSSAWNNFYNFWGGQSESTIWQPDFACGRSYNYQSGGGHAVLCLGYNDTDPNNRYWVMLNSWGTTTGRPAGLFRMNMDMNYDCTNSGLGYAFYWMTLDMDYSERENSPPQTPSLPQGPAQGAVRMPLIYAASAADPDADPVKFDFNWDDGTSSQTGLSASGQGASSHSWAQAGTYTVTAKATDSEGDSSGWSDGLEVAIAAGNRPPLQPASPQGPAAGSLQRSYDYAASAADPDGDDVQLTFDWGDASKSVTEFAKSSEKISASHAWPRTGTYYVRAKATDSKGGQSSSSAYLKVKISDTTNSPPRTPSPPAGVGIGYAGKSYSYLGYASDPNRDRIFYTFDWGDGNSTQTGLLNSGISARMPYTWSQAGAYLVRVMATDSNGEKSAWSSPKKVTIKKSVRSKSPSAARRTAGKSGKKSCSCRKN
jgi:hypothetical protein